MSHYPEEEYLHKANELIDAWLDHQEKECNLIGDSPICKIMAYGCAVSAGYGEADLSMIEAVRKLPPEHNEYKLINLIVDTLKKDKEKSHYLCAAMADRRYNGIDPETDRFYDDGGRAKKVGQDLASYRSNVKTGKRWIYKLYKGWR